MLCLELSVNGNKLATAGLAGYGVISSIITYVRRRREGKGHLDVTLTGLDSDVEPAEHLRWARAKLRAGDRVVVRVLHDRAVDQPRRQTYADAKADRPRVLRLELRAVEVRRRQLQRELEKLRTERTTTPARRRCRKK